MPWSVSGAWVSCSRSYHKQPGAQRDTREALLGDGHVYLHLVCGDGNRTVYLCPNSKLSAVIVCRFLYTNYIWLKAGGGGGKGKQKPESVG